jgi:hypothetical protein
MEINENMIKHYGLSESDRNLTMRSFVPENVIARVIDKQSKKFYSTLIKKEFPIPTFFELMIFRMARTSINLLLDESKRNFTYFKKNGWFESDYYYPAQLNLLKKLAGNFFDFLFNRIYGKGITRKQGQSARTN